MGGEKIKVGVIGGKRGAYVASWCIGLPDAELTVVCDKDAETLEKAKQHIEKELGYTGCVYCADFDEMLNMDIDAVMIATEAIYHVSFVLKALDAGKHVLCEIPSFNSLEEARVLKKAVLSHPELKYMAAENTCYYSFIEDWKKMHDDGQFGKIVYAEAEYLHAINPNDFSPSNYPQNHWRTFNPAIKYLTHELGPLLYIMDDRCVSVSCMEPDVMYNPYFPKKISTGAALLKTEKGAVIRILICFGAYVGYDHNYRLLGTRGSIETDRLTCVDTAHSYANLHSIPGTFNKKIEIPISAQKEGETNEGHGGCDPRMVKEFIRCIKEDKQPVLDVDFAVKMTLPGILAHESAVHGGSAMEIPEI